VKFRASFANKGFDLFPNQFVNIKLTVDTLQGTPIVPDSAIQRGAPGTFVYLAKPDGTVAAQPVTLGPDDGTRVAVLKGLEPGQVVVVDGADRLKDGAKVIVTALDGKATQTPPSQGQPAGQHGQGQGRGEGRGQVSGQRGGG
jgi:multidrug efflux system membrane fusion protein